jgi:hypothetical protein
MQSAGRDDCDGRLATAVILVRKYTCGLNLSTPQAIVHRDIFVDYAQSEVALAGARGRRLIIDEHIDSVCGRKQCESEHDEQFCAHRRTEIVEDLHGLQSWPVMLLLVTWSIHVMIC